MVSDFCWDFVCVCGVCERGRGRETKEGRQSKTTNQKTLCPLFSWILVPSCPYHQQGPMCGGEMSLHVDEMEIHVVLMRKREKSVWKEGKGLAFYLLVHVWFFKHFHKFDWKLGDFVSLWKTKLILEENLMLGINTVGQQVVCNVNWHGFLHCGICKYNVFMKLNFNPKHEFCSGLNM